MKTAISIPDETFAHAERCAATLGMSRSEFFTRAVEQYMEHLERNTLTDEINAAVALLGGDDSGQAAVLHGRSRLAAGDDDW